MREEKGREEPDPSFFLTYQAGAWHIYIFLCKHAADSGGWFLNKRSFHHLVSVKKSHQC